MFEHQFPDLAIKKKIYAIDKTKVEIKLDQNESPYDWPNDLKKLICDKLCAGDWNRYQDAYFDDLILILAKFLNLDSKTLMIGPGSNQLINLIINSLRYKFKNRFIILEPSFSLFKYICDIYGIRYNLWNLDKNLNFDLNNLKINSLGSVIILASPNNPTGNTLKYDELENLLKFNQNSIFVVDEAYYEFSNISYINLIKKYNNLIIIRTFSKAYSAASIRFGYIISNSNYINIFKKFLLPYSINPFTSVAVKTILNSKNYMKVFQDNISKLKNNRDKLYFKIKNIINNKKLDIEIFPSQANFLLIRFANKKDLIDLYDKLKLKSILIRDLSQSNFLSRCLRISIGNEIQNDYFIKVMESIYD